MINVTAVIVANGIAILILFLLLLNFKNSIGVRLFDEKLFYFMVIVCFFQAILEASTLCMDGHTFAGARNLCLVLNALLYSINLLFAVVWNMYVDYKLFGDIVRTKKRTPIMAIPALVGIIASIASIFTPIIFSISENNVYQRTKISTVIFIMSFLYMITSVIESFRYKNKTNKYIFLPVLTFMIPAALGTILQFSFYGISLIWVGVAIALNSLYINVQSENNCIDLLSRLYTRSYMSNFLESKTKKTAPELSGIMIDIDKFKSINDNFGHLAGDDAIACFGEIIRKSIPKDAIGIRYAGDEFVIIMQSNDKNYIDDVVDKIDANTIIFNTTENKPYKLQYSLGKSIYNPKGDTIDAFLNRMDNKMYEQKRSKKY